MPTAVRIDATRLADVWTLLDPYLAEIGEPPLSDPARARIASAVDRADIQFFVADGDDAPVGLCSLTLGFSTYRASTFGLLEDFYVAPAWRGRGVARMLIACATEYAASRDCASVMAGCSPGDVPMWKHFAFRPLGVLVAKDVEKDV